MKTYLTEYSLSISIFIVFILFWILEYFTMSGSIFESAYWNRSFFIFKIATFVILGCTIIFTILIHNGSPFTRKAHIETHDKLDRILKYLEISDNNK